MRPDELMVGNWVKIQEPDKYAGAIGQVNSLISLKGGYFAINIQDPQFGYLVTEVFCDDIAPIPLTAGMLEKNGFEEEEEERGFSEPYRVYVNNDFQYVVKIYPKEGMDRYSRLEIGEYDDSEHVSLLINHVHELQHAMRLAGINKELTIKNRIEHGKESEHRADQGSDTEVKSI